MYISAVSAAASTVLTELRLYLQEARFRTALNIHGDMLDNRASNIWGLLNDVCREKEETVCHL